MAVITISREFASGARFFAQKLSEELGYSILEKELVAQIADRLNITASEATLFEKESESRLLRFLDRYTSHTVKRVVDQSYGRLDDRSYYEATSNLVLKAAEEGNIIIMGWGSQCVLRDRPDTLHLRIVKDLTDRIAFVKTNYSLDERGAGEHIEREDNERANYIQRYFGCSWDDPHLYHMVLNLGKLTLEEATNIVMSYLSRRHGSH